MNALRSSLRPAARALLPKAQKRQMGGGAAPQWTGLDKVIRDKFPEDYQGEILYSLRERTCLSMVTGFELLCIPVYCCVCRIAFGASWYFVWTKSEI